MVTAVLVAVILLANLPIQQASAVVAACSSAAAAQNGITVVPSHGQVFYIDTGVTPVLDAGYIGYRVTNSTGSSHSDLWTEVSSFAGGSVGLSNSLDSMMQLPTLADGTTGTSYFLLKATTATTTAQTHTVKVYDGRPDLSGSSMLYQCTFTFSKVLETLKTASNKVANNGLTSSAAIEVNDTSPELGQAVVITVEGQTGQIGSGSASADGSIVWLTPAAISSWPTRALRLESVSIIFDKNNNWNTVNDQVTYTNQLLISDAKTAIGSAQYRATYTFRVVGVPASTVKAVPLAQIASGTQIKHADTSATGATLDISFSATQINASLAKTVTSTTGLATATCTETCVVPGGVNGATYVAVPYLLEATTNTATTVKLDEFVDTPAEGVIFKPGSASITDIGRSAVAVDDPVFISSESGAVPRPIHFVGPFTMSSATPASLSYTMWVPVGTYANSAYAKLGDTIVGVNPSAMSQVTVVSNGTSTVTSTTGTVTLGVVITTDPATSIDTTIATINGTVDPNGTTPLTGEFKYGTDPALAGATTVTASTPVAGALGGLTVPTHISYNLTGLTSNTTYYFQAVAGSDTGEILSFTTLAITAPPTPIATGATSVALTSATLNGTINPNLTSVTGIQFIYGTSDTLASGNTTYTVDDGSGLAALTIAGASTQAFTYDVTGLVAGTTYYYKIRACTSALTGSYPNVSCASYVDSSIVSFVASSSPTVVTSAATLVGASIATLNGSINPNYASTDASFVYGTDPTLNTGTLTTSAGTLTGTGAQAILSAISGLTPSTTYYFRAVGTNNIGSTAGAILSFVTLAVNRTLAIDPSSYSASYFFTDTEPTITSTASAGGGTKSYTSYTTDVCTINATTGKVTFVGTGTCTIGVSIAASGEYSDASAENISFTVEPISRTLTIDPDSFEDSYSTTESGPTIVADPSAGGGTITYSSLTPDVCGINPATGAVVILSAGTCTIGAEIESTTGYSSAIAETISFTINLASRTLAIDAASYVSEYSTTSSPPTITSTASAGIGTKSYSSSTPDICTIDSASGVVSFVSPGTCTINASITSDGIYNQADADPISFEISTSNRTLEISSTPQLTYTMADIPPIVVSVPTAGGGIITYSSSTPGVCTVDPDSGVVMFVVPGTCTIGSEITADGQYDSAISGTVSFTITLATRTLTIDADSYEASYYIDETEPTITSTPSAGMGTKSYSSSTLSICSIGVASGNVVFLSAGICTIGASIDEDGTYNTADAVAVSFTISLLTRTLSIDDSSYQNSYKLTDSPPTITSSASAGGGTKSYTSTTPDVCSIDSATGIVTFLTTGTCTIAASITSTALHNSANAIAISFVITTNQASQPGGGRSRSNHIWGCTDRRASNYNPSANVNDGSCRTVQPTAPPEPAAKPTPEPARPQPASPSAQPPHSKNNKSKIEYTEPIPETCGSYIRTFIKLGKDNDVEDVKRLQTFLNYKEGEMLVIDGVYKKVDEEAVKRFQKKYAEVLGFWGIRKPTGYVYVSTLQTINKLYCEQEQQLSCPHFTKYAQLGTVSTEVSKIKVLLNKLFGLTLDTESELYDKDTAAAVRKFQRKYANEVLYPWGIAQATGKWYQSSRKKANDLVGCYESVRLDNGNILK